MPNQVDNFKIENDDVLQDSNNNGKYELQSEEVQEILSYIPHD